MNTELHPLTGERAITFTHASGLTVAVLEKPLHTYYALLGTAFGSIHRDVRIDGVRYRLPDGTAHFLEHKLFDQPDGSDAFTRFAAIGADANAFTTYLSTACLFDCTEHFEEALEILLRFVTTSHFTHETVAKELPIIGEEIAADRDSPAETLYNDILKALYKNHPVRRPILGSRSSIAQLTPELLTTVHRAFYHPARLTLCVAGQITADAVAKICDRVFSSPLPPAPVAELLPAREPATVCKAHTVRKWSVTQPTVAFGIKLLPAADEDIPRTAAALEVLGCLLFGESSALSHRLYREGTISGSLTFEATVNHSFGHLIVFANTDHPDETLAALRSALDGFDVPDPEDFLACRRMELGDLFRSLDSTEEFASDYLAHRMEGSNLFAYADALSALTPSDVTALADRLRDPTHMAEALILPKD